MEHNEHSVEPFAVAIRPAEQAKQLAEAERAET